MKFISLILILLSSVNLMAATAGQSPRVSGVSVTSTNAALGQTGYVTMSLWAGNCDVTIQSEASIQSVPSVDPKYPMDAIVINVAPALTNCAEDHFGKWIEVSAETDQLVQSALAQIAPEKRSLPKILRLPEVAL